VASYLILVSRGSIQLAGVVDDLLARHRVLTGPAAETGRYAGQLSVVHAGHAHAHAHAQARLLVRASAAADLVPPGWAAHPVGLEELAIAYLRGPGAAALPGPACSRRAKPAEVTE